MKDFFIEKFNEIINIYQKNLTKIKSFGAHPSLLDSIEVNYYGTSTPINQISNIKVQSPTLLLINLYDKTLVKEIMSIINKSKIDVTVVEDSSNIKVIVAPLTEDKRKLSSKQAKELSEQAKISIRNLRRDFIKKIQSMDELSADEKRKETDNLQNLVEKFNLKISKIFEEKNNQLLTI